MIIIVAIVCLVIGGVLGVGLTALCVAAASVSKREADNFEDEATENGEEIEHST